MRKAGGSAVWGRYGFADAFNPETGWVSPDVIGIDVGITLVMAENLRSGLVWRHFMNAAEVRRGMRRAGFSPTPQKPDRRVLVEAIRIRPATPTDRDTREKPFDPSSSAVGDEAPTAAIATSRDRRVIVRG